VGPAQLLTKEVITLSPPTAFRLAVLGVLLAAGVGSALLLTPAAQSHPADCILPGVCVTTAVPPLPPLPSVPTATTGTPTETQPATPAPTPPTPPSTASPPPPSPTETGTAPEAGDRAPQAKFQVRLVSAVVSGRGARRTLVVTATSSRRANATLSFRARPRAVRAALRFVDGKNVRRIRLPRATRSGRYLLSLSVRDADGTVRTLRRNVSVRR